MKPYYEHGGITIYHGDCREVLPCLPTDSVDLLVTDPPYGINWKSNQRREKLDGIHGDNSIVIAMRGLNASIRVWRRTRHAYVFGRFDLSTLPVSEPVELIWDKRNMSGGDLSCPWGMEHEYILFFTNCKRDGVDVKRGGLAARLRKGSVLSFQRITSTQGDLHPTEKPLPLLRELIESSSRIGETVLDPFMGSGSTLKACELEGRNAIGIEIEERYCEIAAKRLSQEVLQF